MAGMSAGWTDRPIGPDEAASNLDNVLHHIGYAKDRLSTGACQCGGLPVGDALKALRDAIDVAAQTRTDLRTEYDDGIDDPP